MKKNKIFCFFASVKLAVPLMLVLAICIAIGTFLESRYNAEFARLMVYQAEWFYGILALLWLNILCATLSRIPFNINHTGFVITHIGLLTLLIGSFITAFWGVDGQLTILEGAKSHNVILNNLSIEYINAENNQVKIFELPRWSSEKKINSKLDDQLIIRNYRPFTKTVESFESTEGGGGAVQFFLKSPFFKVTQWMDEEEKNEIQMGPAKFKLKQKIANFKSENKPKLMVYGAKGNSPLGEIKLTNLVNRDVILGGVAIRFVKSYEQAVVTSNKLIEKGGKGKNPALELILEKSGKKLRELTFARFPDFSLHQEPPFGLKFIYWVPSEAVESYEGNLVEIQLDKTVPDKAKISLIKNKKIVMEKTLAQNEVLEMPWMGIQISLLNIFTSAKRVFNVIPTEVQERSPLPQAAVLIENTISGERFWLAEEQSQQFRMGQGQASVYFGKKMIQLPFEVRLKKFIKTDYPGTQTPLSFESVVEIEGETGSSTVISMNEPFKKAGYTLYQSSYILQPNSPPATVISVNKDPGRFVKYAGSIILAFGIVIFTIMRSQKYKKWRSSKK